MLSCPWLDCRFPESASSVSCLMAGSYLLHSAVLVRKCSNMFSSPHSWSVEQPPATSTTSHRHVSARYPSLLVSVGMFLEEHTLQHAKKNIDTVWLAKPCFQMRKPSMSDLNMRRCIAWESGLSRITHRSRQKLLEFERTVVHTVLPGSVSLTLDHIRLHHSGRRDVVGAVVPLFFQRLRDTTNALNMQREIRQRHISQFDHVPGRETARDAKREQSSQRQSEPCSARLIVLPKARCFDPVCLHRTSTHIRSSP